MYIPASTYRIQLHKGFDFSQLLARLPYLHELGITTLYASPVTRAVSGSAHGYDGTDPLEINPEIGTAGAWEGIIRFMEEHGMGWLQDIVPNHMAFSTENEMIYDLLERGEYSDYKEYFDIISPQTGKGGPFTRIMVPFLGKEPADCVRDGDLKLGFGSAGFFIEYTNQHYPVAISSYHWICSIVPDFFQPLLAWSDKTASFSLLPWPKWIHFRSRMMAEIFQNPRLCTLAMAYCDFINRDSALLQELLDFQPYELCSWKSSFSRMNYRRFFAVNSLICLRMEEEAVFDYWHQLLVSLVQQGWVQGFRVDHVDGLFNPGIYLQKLRGAAGPDVYIVVEKILQEKEEVPAGWPVQGTTGYDFLSFANQLLTDQAGKEKLTGYFQKNILPESYEDMVFEKKLAFLRSHLKGEWNNLMRWLTPVMAQRKNHPGTAAVKEALGVLMAAFPVYRIYAEQLPLSETDQQWLDQAFAKARAKAPRCQNALDWMKELFQTGPEDPLAGEILYFLRRWSQITAPLAAKGTEDCVFYNYNALIGLNEVGDSPRHAPVTAATFHRLMQNRQEKTPLSLNASSTHDSKRGEDNRLRINLISLFAEEWIALVENWKKLNQPFVSAKDNRRAPSLNDEYLIYQALTGAIPDAVDADPGFGKRFAAYLTKALREENQETRWEEPDALYEKDCQDFVTAILSPDHGFLGNFMPLVKKIVSAAAVFSLSQTLLKLTAPGIPDIYQGAELWDLSLVDPDNRLPVDYPKRADMLAAIGSEEEKSKSAVLDYILQQQTSGAQKLFLIRTLLHYRRANPELFSRGLYIPVVAIPTLIGYIRSLGDQQLLILAPLPSTDGKTAVSGTTGIRGRWKNLFTGLMADLDESLDSAVLLKEFPVGAFILQND